MPLDVPLPDFVRGPLCDGPGSILDERGSVWHPRGARSCGRGGRLGAYVACEALGTSLAFRQE